MVSCLATDQGLSINRSCQLVNLSRAAYYREDNKLAVRDARVVEALNAVAAKQAAGDSGSVMTGCGYGSCMESQADLAGVLRHEAQSAASCEEAID